MASIFYSIMTKVRDEIRALDLSLIDDDKVVIAKVMNERETVFPGMPGILILPLGNESIPVTAGTTCKDDVAYPIGVVMLDADRQDTSTEIPAGADQGTQDQDFRFDTRLTWRERIRKRFMHQRLNLTSVAADVYTCHVEPQAVVTRSDWLEDNIYMSVLVLRFWSREGRGA